MTLDDAHSLLIVIHIGTTTSTTTNFAPMTEYELQNEAITISITII